MSGIVLISNNKDEKLYYILYKEIHYFYYKGPYNCYLFIINTREIFSLLHIKFVQLLFQHRWRGSEVILTLFSFCVEWSRVQRFFFILRLLHFHPALLRPSPVHLPAFPVFNAFHAFLLYAALNLSFF